jgi:choline-sulfatase
MKKFDRSRRDVLGLAGASALGLLGLPLEASGAAEPAAATRPNLILYFPDEMRADALGCYGNPVARTPNFDRFASQGARFANCHAQHPVCGASRCSLLTGWPTSVHGHRSLYYFLRPDEPNLFRYLKNAGYDVYWLGRNDALASQSFPDSVTEWYDVPAPRLGSATPTAANPAGPTTMLLPGGAPAGEGGDHALVQRAIRMLETRKSDRPFCIFLALTQPHPPYRAPARFDTMYDPATLPPLVPPNLPRKPGFHAAIRKAYGLDGVSDLELRKVRATYYGQVSYADWLFGQLLDALDRTGHANDTAVLLASDHGDYAGDYGLVEKWPSGLESALTHVPLIARIPGGARGIVCEDMVELYDLMATMLELGGTRATHTHFARSLVPQLHGAPGDAQRAAFSEGGYNTYEPQAFEPPLAGIYHAKSALQLDQPDVVSRVASVKTRRYTYIARPGGQSELYDRARDPVEANNLIASPAHAAILNQMRERLLNWYVNTTGVPPLDKDPRDLPPFYPTPATLPDDARRRARILDGDN